LIENVLTTPNHSASFAELRHCAPRGRLTMATGQSLRDRQVASLKEVLNLNQPVKAGEDGHTDGGQAGSGADGELIWKVLVFDDLGRDVISSVMRVSDLRAM
jgi:sec1 family domain-containing protein 1